MRIAAAIVLFTMAPLTWCPIAWCRLALRDWVMIGFCQLYGIISFAWAGMNMCTTYVAFSVSSLLGPRKTQASHSKRCYRRCYHVCHVCSLAIPFLWWIGQNWPPDVWVPEQCLNAAGTSSSIVWGSVLSGWHDCPRDANTKCSSFSGCAIGAMCSCNTVFAAGAGHESCPTLESLLFSTGVVVKSVDVANGMGAIYAADSRAQRKCCWHLVQSGQYATDPCPRCCYCFASHGISRQGCTPSLRHHQQSSASGTSLKCRCDHGASHARYWQRCCSCPGDGVPSGSCQCYPGQPW